MSLQAGQILSWLFLPHLLWLCLWLFHHGLVEVEPSGKSWLGWVYLPIQSKPSVIQSFGLFPVGLSHAPGHLPSWEKQLDCSVFPCHTKLDSLELSVTLCPSVSSVATLITVISFCYENPCCCFYFSSDSLEPTTSFELTTMFLLSNA